MFEKLLEITFINFKTIICIIRIKKLAKSLSKKIILPEALPIAELIFKLLHQKEEVQSQAVAIRMVGNLLHGLQIISFLKHH